MSNAIGRAIPEPKSWDDDGGARIEVVTDPNWIINGQPRLVRRVGWRQCMVNKRHRFLSEDLARIRCCPACRQAQTVEFAKTYLRSTTGKGPGVDDRNK